MDIDDDIMKEHPWLAELIEKAEADGSGEYRGSIWIEKYDEQTIFVTNMRIGDSSRVFRFFDSDGLSIAIEDSELLTMKFNAPIYSNIEGGEKIEIPDIDDSITACGVKQPQKNLDWLAVMLIKAEVDKTARYLGTIIWLEKYKGEDVFVIHRDMASILYRVFDCSGNFVEFPDEKGFSFSDTFKFNQMVYTNIPKCYLK
jgi:hypothetical protein